MKIIKRIIPQTQWRIKCPYSMTPKYITIHNTANKASAENEYQYAFKGGGKNSPTGWHWVVDDKCAIQAIPNTKNAFHAGDGAYGKGNRESIGIEICYSTDYKSDRFYKAVDNAIELTKMLMVEYNIPISHVVRHFDWSGKHCPHRIMDEGTWEEFKQRLEGADKMKIINKDNGNRQLRKVSDAFNVYVKEGTVPQIKYKTFKTGDTVWHMVFVKPTANVLVTLDYMWDNSLQYVSNLTNDYLLKNGYKRAVGVNGGYFEMATGKPVGGLQHNWSNKWAEFKGQPLEPCKGKGYPTIFTKAEIGAPIEYLDGWASEFELSKHYWTRSVGQSLVLNGEVDSRIGEENGRYNQRNCDAMIGMTKDNEYILAVNTVKGMTHAERASIMCREGAYTAFDLDGGGSCCMVVDESLVNLEPVANPTTKHLYRVRKEWKDTESQIGAYSDLENAKVACKEGYKVFDENGNVVYVPTNEHVSSDVLKENAQLKIQVKQLQQDLAKTKIKLEEVLKLSNKIVEEIKK